MNNKITAAIFFSLTFLFIISAIFNKDFFEWIFERHHNRWSWYIRPLFLIPFCFFAYRKNLAGIAFTIFCLFTSMFWFAKPDIVPENVKAFLQFEKEWLTGNWGLNKTLLTLTVPLSFILLGLAIWYKNLWMVLSVVILIAIGKIIWSVQNAGESGKAIIIPALIGLFICVVTILYGFWHHRK